jgi:hypothetical protein
MAPTVSYDPRDVAKFCSECGGAVDGAKFCPACRHRIGDGETTADAPPTAVSDDGARASEACAEGAA